MTFVNQFNAKGDLLMEKLRSLADGQTVVNLLDEFNRAALDAIALIAFGMNIDSINKTDNELRVALQETVKIQLEATFDPFFKVYLFIF
jgi:hypothetical protein